MNTYFVILSTEIIVSILRKMKWLDFCPVLCNFKNNSVINKFINKVQRIDLFARISLSIVCRVNLCYTRKSIKQVNYY